MTKPKKEHAVNVPDNLVKELLTASELRMVKQRLLIIKLLDEGEMSVRQIAQQVGVGTDTVVRMARKLESSPMLRKLFRSNPDNQQLSKWTFGVSEKE